MSPTALLAACAAVAATWALAEVAEAWPAGARRPRAGPAGVDGPPAGGPLVRALLRLGRRTGRLAPPLDLPRRLAAAGLDPRWTPADLMALKGGLVLLVLVTLLPLAVGLPGALGPLSVVVLPAGAFLLPDRWLVLRARRRARVMAIEVADVLDLLRVAVAAGLPVGRAMVEVGRRHPGTIAIELRRAGREIAAGVPRDTALDGFAARAPLPALTALVAAIHRADRHGVPLAPTLAALAADARADRARALADHAARAAPKIQLVIALLLVPAVLLLVAAAMVSAL